MIELETYTPERIAEFLLNNATSDEEYREAEREVRAMGLDPRGIPQGEDPEH